MDAGSVQGQAAMRAPPGTVACRFCFGASPAESAGIRILLRCVPDRWRFRLFPVAFGGMSGVGRNAAADGHVVSRRPLTESRGNAIGIVIVMSLLLLAACDGRKNEGPDRPNVLFIVTDDMNDDLQTFGHPVVQSPHLDRLAARGLRLKRAYCQVPICNPSRVSLLSGLRLERTGVYTLYQPTRQNLPDALTLPEYFTSMAISRLRSVRSSTPAKATKTPSRGTSRSGSSARILAPTRS